MNIQHSNGPTPISGFSYAYDDEGNRKFENKLQDLTHAEGYQYDTTNRLISYKVGTLVGSTVPAPSTQTAYSLDPVGNWNSKTTDAVTQTRLHDTVNELVKIDATNLTYDTNGNLQNDGSYSYQYDEENRLTKVTRLSDSAIVGQYQYDALGRRVQKIANPAGSATTTRYFYDGNRVIEEQDAGGATLATYVYGSYIDEVLTMDRAAQTYYYHQNAADSVEAITDGTGTPVERYSYDAYGVVTVTNGGGVAVPPNGWGTPHSAIGNPWTFTGRQFDEESGLYFYRARYYDPAKGRFIQRDPLEYVDGYNLYQYAVSNPINLLDPSGLEVTKERKAGTDYIDDWMKESRDEDLKEYRQTAEKLKNSTKFKTAARRAQETLEEKTKENRYTQFFDGLAELGKEFDKVETLFISGSDTAGQFAEHAAKCGKECVVSLYFGHGSGAGRSAAMFQFANTNPLLAVNNLFANFGGEDLQGSVFSVRRAAQALNELEGSKGDKAARVAFYSCHAGCYNQVVPKANRAGAWGVQTATWLGRVPEVFREELKGLKEMAAKMKKACDKTKLQIYWGAR